jgi:hypothetical protein
MVRTILPILKTGVCVESKIDPENPPPVYDVVVKL